MKSPPARPNVVPGWVVSVTPGPTYIVASATGGSFVGTATTSSWLWMYESRFETINSGCDPAAATPARTSAPVAASPPSSNLIYDFTLPLSCTGLQGSRPSSFLQSRDGSAASGGLRLRRGRAHRPARVPRDDAPRGLRLPGRPRPAAVWAE